MSVSGDATFDFDQLPRLKTPNCPDSCANYTVTVLPTVQFRVGIPGCKSVSSNPGQLTSQENSLDFSVGLGVGTNFQGQSKLTVHSELPMVSLSTPQALTVDYTDGAVWTATDANGLRQVLSGDVLVDIVTNNAYQYDMRCYRAVNAGSISGGLYQPVGDPFKVVTVQNPDPSTNYNRLWVTTAEGDATNLYEYSCPTNSTVYSNYWELVFPSNLRKETLLTTWTTNWSVKTTLRSIYTPGSPDVLVYQEQNKYVDYGFGNVLAEQVIGTSGVSLTNTWAYYTNSADVGSYGNLQQKTEWNGYWEQYQYDNVGRETNRIIAYMNAPVGSAAALCRSIMTSYSNGAPNITRVETIFGQEIGRTYMALYSASNAVETVRCQTPGASFTDSGNLVSIVSRDSVYRPTNVINIDGTRAFYTYYLVGGIDYTFG
jgi:hypothetical protein